MLLCTVNGNELSFNQIDVFVEGHVLIERLGAVQNDNSVADGIHKLLVVRGQKHTALKGSQAIVERRD